MQAFKPKNWPALTAPVPFAVTPGGFVKASFPQSDNRKRGWNSEPEDFQQLVPCMEKVLWRVVTEEVLIAARPRARFLTVGVDLNNLGVKARTGEYAHDTHVEMVAVVDTDSGKIVCCTGKSYPVNWQEKTLVQETNLESHLFRWGKKYVLVLGCHDLNMFSNRAYNNQNQKGLRRKRCDKMRKLVKNSNRQSFCNTHIQRIHREYGRRHGAVQVNGYRVDILMLPVSHTTGRKTKMRRKTNHVFV